MNCLEIDHAEAAKTRCPRNITPCDGAGDCGYKNIQEGYGSGGFPLSTWRAVGRMGYPGAEVARVLSVTTSAVIRAAYSGGGQVLQYYILAPRLLRSYWFFRFSISLSAELRIFMIYSFRITRMSLIGPSSLSIPDNSGSLKIFTIDVTFPSTNIFFETNRTP